MEDRERVVSPDRDQDEAVEATIRPARITDFIGQDGIREALGIAIAAARQRGEALDHILLSGPPGLGKTTLAHIIAHEMESQIHTTSGPVLERAGDIAAILTTMKRGDILFIDEVHRLPTVVEEILYPAMEDLHIDVVIGEGPSARSIRLSLEQFTLVGATTRIGLLSSPFRDRFGMVARVNLYTPDELALVVQRGSSILGVQTTADGCLEIARRSRGTPRIALRLLRRARDYALIRADGCVSAEVADQALTMLGIDRFGLDELDRRILSVIVDHFGGGPVGVKTIAIAVGEEPRTIEEVYEPYLIQAGYLKRTAQGREATEAARQRSGKAWW